LIESINQIEDDKPRIVDPAVRIFEAAAKSRPQWLAFGRMREIETAARRKLLASTEMIVEEQAGPHQPGRALLRRMRQYEAHRPDDVGR